MKAVQYLIVLFVLATLLGGVPALAQTGTLKGVVTDESGGIVSGATVTLTGPLRLAKQTMSGESGSYEFRNFAVGTYTAEASAPQLTLTEPIRFEFKSAVQVVNLKLKVAPMRQQVNVNEDAGPTVSTDSAGNANAVILRGANLDALADDPEDLATDLQALAGPSAGPSGGSMYIDGFSGGQLPPKDAIREIRINQNPFSPEYDTLGYGPIEVSPNQVAQNSTGAPITISASASGTRETRTPARRHRFCSTSTGGASKDRS
jgi:Carboxypeptidase regulatory-like domain